MLSPALSQRSQREPISRGNSIDSAAQGPSLAQYVSGKRAVDQRLHNNNNNQSALGTVTPIQGRRVADQRPDVDSSLFLDARTLLASPTSVQLSERLQARLQSRAVATAATPTTGSSRVGEAATTSSVDQPQPHSYDDDHHHHQSLVPVHVAPSSLATQRHYGEDERGLWLVPNSRRESPPSLHHHSSLAAPPTHQTSAGALVLQGRLEALQSLLAEKDTTIDEQHRRAIGLENEVGDLRKKLDESNRKVDMLAAVDVQRQEACRNAEDEVEHTRRQFHELRRLLTEEQRRNAALEDALQKTREEVHMVTQSSEQTRLLEQQMREEKEARLRGELRSMQDESVHMNELRREAETKTASLEAHIRQLTQQVESLRVVSAQESIERDSLKYDLEKLRQRMVERDAEVESLERSLATLKGASADFDDQREEHYRTVAELHTAQAAVEKLTIELSATQLSEDFAKRKIAQLEVELEELNALSEEMARLQATADGRQLSIDQLSNAERGLKERIAGLEEAGRSAAAREERLVEELSSLNRRLEDQERSLRDRDDELTRLQEIAIGAERLKSVVEERTRMVQQLQLTIDQLKRENGELDSDVETLLGVKGEVDRLAGERHQLLQQLADRDAALFQKQRENAHLDGLLRQREVEVRSAQKDVSELKLHSQRLSESLADRNQLEGRLRELTNELTLRNDDVDRAVAFQEELQNRLLAKEKDREGDARRQREAESQILQLQQDLGRLQMEMGRQSVQNESLQREKQRLQREAEIKTASADEAQLELAELRKTLQQLQAEHQALTTKERTAQDQRRAIEEHLRDVQQTLDSERATFQRMRQEAAQKDEKLIQYRVQQERDQGTHSEKESALQRLRQREGEMEQLLTQLHELETRAQEHETERRLLQTQLHDAKSTYERSAKLMQSLEADDASKGKQLLERERELQRVKDRLQGVTAELESERNRRKQHEQRLRDLEASAHKLSALDGQVAGLQLVLAQRTKDLEEERRQNSELRVRLRQTVTERSASTRSSAPEDVARRVHLDKVEQDLAQRSKQVEQLQDEVQKLMVARNEAEHRASVADAERSRLLHELKDLNERFHQGNEAHSRGTEALTRELAASRQHEAKLEQELTLCRTELDQLSRSQRSSSEWHRTSMALHTAESQLVEKSVELETANDNLATLQRRLRDELARRGVVRGASESRARSVSVSSSSAGQPAEQRHSESRHREPEPSHITTAPPNSVSLPPTTLWDPAATDQAIQRWRERRKMVN